MALTLERRAFAGTARTVDEFDEDFVGDASFSGCVAFVTWPRERVAHLLPPALELAPPAAGLIDEHPVAFVFGHQRQGAIMFAGFRLPMSIDFGEFALAIPFVRHRAGRHLHTYVPRMLSSYFPAVWDGCIRYGYRKDLATMRWLGDTFLVTDEHDALLFHAIRECQADWTPGAEATALTAPLRDVFGLPIVASKPDGRLICAYWGWGFDTACVRPSAARLFVDGPLFPALTPQESYGADLTIEVRGMAWKLSLPLPCRP